MVNSPGDNSTPLADVTSKASGSMDCPFKSRLLGSWRMNGGSSYHHAFTNIPPLFK